MTLRPLFLVAAASLLAAACGGRQSSDALATRQWASVFELVPADATYAYIFDPNEVDAQRVFEQLQEQQTSDLLAPYAAIFDGLRTELGIDLTSQQAVIEAGLDPAGEFAVFSVDIAPIFALRLSDEEAWHQTLERILQLNPDIELESFNLAGLEMDRLNHASEDMAIDFGVMNGYLVGRLSEDDGAGVLSDSDFIRILSGAGDDIRTSDIAEATGPLIPEGQEMSSLAFIRTDVINRMANLMLSGELSASSEALNAMGMAGAVSTGGYESTAQRTACNDAVERAIITWPFTAAVSTRLPGQLSSTSHLVLQFSEAGAERIEAAFPGSVEGLFDMASNAALFIAGRADLATLIDLFPNDPALVSCPDMARGLAMIGQGIEANRRTVNQNLRLFNGGGAIAVFDIAPAGLSVDADIAVMVTSDEPSNYADRLQRLLQRNGFSARVAPEAPITTIVFDSFLAELTMMMTDDRLVLYTGELEPAFINSIALNPEANPGQPFLQMSINTRTLETIYNNVVDFLSVTGALSETNNTMLAAGFSPLFEMESITVVGGFNNNAMIISTASVLRD